MQGARGAYRCLRVLRLSVRTIPSIEQLRQRPAILALEPRYGRTAVVEALRAEAAAHLALLDVGEALAPSLPHREQALLLNHRLARRLVQAHLDWLDEVEAELAPRRGRRRGSD